MILMDELRHRAAALDGLGALQIGGVAALALARRIKRVISHPTHKLFRALQRRGVRAGQLDVLEIFGGAGETTREYAGNVRSLEVWENDPALEEELRRNLPGARIRITDAYAEVQRATGTYDLVLIDNWVAHSGEGDPEHFDLFPHVFRLLRPGGVLVMVVLPEASAEVRTLYPHLFRASQLAQRKRFYEAEDPEHIPLPALAAAYRRKAAAAGWEVEWGLFVRRSFVYYHALRLRPAA